MKKSFGLKPMSALFATMFAASALAGCGDKGVPGNPAGDLCCTDFKVGADLRGTDWGLDGAANAKFSVFAQASADLSAVATGALDDMFIACQNIAVDLGADPADASVAGKGGKDGMDAWCTLAVAQINAKFGASGTFSGSLTVNYEPPKCSASFSATVDCQGSCDASAMCDVKATPPKCTGGTLSVECKGTCSGSASAAVSCTGECSGKCDGSCQAQAGATVACKGKCDGTCTADAMAGGTGAQADGTCDGQCDGSCEMSGSASATCSGTCSGKCDADCKAQANVNFKCDGSCDAEASPPTCEGGTLEGGCMVSADCQASCNGSASAKAECTPPSVSIQAAAEATATGDAAIELHAALASLEANLPNILVVVKARGAAFTNTFTAVVNAGASVSGSVTSSVKASACALAIVGVLGEASGNFAASLSAAGKITGALKIG